MVGTASPRRGARVTHVLRTRAELRAALAAAPRPIGLVPTMGWLHAGHRSLMARSRAENPTSVMTLFVNPKQFNSEADLARNEEAAAALQKAVPAGIRLTPTREWRVMGASVPRIDRRDTVTGAHKYPSDYTRPGMLYETGTSFAPALCFL